MLAAIDTEGLLELIWVAPLAAVVVALTYALALRGWALAAEAARERQGARAFGYGMLAVVATLTFAAAVVFGIAIIVAKD